tara:strand:+ start:359 stop:562 length:204 start_codon:yes stop_codon:yes gene_type:complete
MRNFWLASDIIITKDSEGFFSADHKYQGDLIIDGEYDTMAECIQDAVNILKEKKEYYYNEHYSQRGR